MRTIRIACLAACSILAVVAAILLGPTLRDLKTSPPPVSSSSPEEKSAAATFPSTPTSPPATEVSESGAYLGSLTPPTENPASPALSTEEAQAQLQKALQVETDGPNGFRIGTVSFDRARRTITVPATVNMDAGVVEYALVAESGKVHEALFATSAKPQQIHMACLLLGMAADKKDTATEPAKKELKVKVMWDTNGPPAEHDLSQMVVTADDPNSLENARPLPMGAWNYVGSVIDGQGFAANREGSIISLIRDAQALVDNPRESAKRDDIHFPNKALVPPKGSPVRIVLTLSGPVGKP